MVLQHTPPAVKTYGKGVNRDTTICQPSTRQPSVDSTTILSTPFYSSSQFDVPKLDDGSEVIDDNDDDDGDDDDDNDLNEINDVIVVQERPTEPTRPVTPRSSSRTVKSKAQKDEVANATPNPSPRKRKPAKSKPSSDDGYSLTKKPRTQQQEDSNVMDALFKQIEFLTEQVSQLQQSKSTSVQPPSRSSSRPSSRPPSRASSRSGNHQPLNSHHRPSSRTSSRSSNHSHSSSSRFEDPIIPQPPAVTRKFLEPPQPPLASGNPTPFVQFTAPNPFTGTSITPNTLLRYWPWVETAQLTAIASGTFNFKDLLKLL